MNNWWQLMGGGNARNDDKAEQLVGGAFGRKRALAALDGEAALD